MIEPGRERGPYLDKFRHNLRAQASKVYLVLEEHKRERLTDEQLLTLMRSIAQKISWQCQMFEDWEKLNATANLDVSP